MGYNYYSKKEAREKTFFHACIGYNYYTEKEVREKKVARAASS